MARLVCVALCLCAASARADIRLRPEDRFFFGLFAGADTGDVDRLTQTVQQTGRPSLAFTMDHAAARPGWTVGYDEQYWINDFIGLGFNAEVFDFTVGGSARCAAS